MQQMWQQLCEKRCQQLEENEKSFIKMPSPHAMVALVEFAYHLHIRRFNETIETLRTHRAVIARIFSESSLLFFNHSVRNSSVLMASNNSDGMKN